MFLMPPWRVHDGRKPSILGVDQLAFRQLEQYRLEDIMVTENKLELTDREDIRSGNEPARVRSNEVSIAGADLMFPVGRILRSGSHRPTGDPGLCRRRSVQIHCPPVARQRCAERASP